MTADEVGFLIDRAGSIWAYEKTTLCGGFRPMRAPRLPDAS